MEKPMFGFAVALWGALLPAFIPASPVSGAAFVGASGPASAAAGTVALKSISPDTPVVGGREPVLAAICYHRFGIETRLDPYCISPTRLAGELRWLRADGWAGVSLTQVAAALDGDTRALPPKGVLLSVDDGYKAGALGAPVFERYGYRAVYFIVPSMLGHGVFLSYRDLRALEARGHEVASHTLTHPHLALVPAGMDAAAYVRWVDRELVEPKRLLEKALGHPVDALAWPYGVYNPAVAAAALRAGYRQLWSVSGGLNLDQSLDRARLRRIVLVGRTPLWSFKRRLRGLPLRVPVDCIGEGDLFYRSQLPLHLVVPRGLGAAVDGKRVVPDAAGGLTLGKGLGDGFHFLNFADKSVAGRRSASLLFQVAPDAWKPCFEALSAGDPPAGKP